jgi:hypothetical protein
MIRDDTHCVDGIGDDIGDILDSSVTSCRSDVWRNPPMNAFWIKISAASHDPNQTHSVRPRPSPSVDALDYSTQPRSPVNLEQLTMHILNLTISLDSV